MKNLKFIYVCVACLVFFLIAFVACNSGFEKHEKIQNILYKEPDARKIKIISGLQKLQQLPFSQNGNNFNETKEQISKVIDDFENSDDLTTFALMSRNLSRHCFDMDCFKESSLRPTYENAYWIIVEKLAKDKNKNEKVLETLKNESQLKDTDLGDWGKIVDGKEFP